MNLDNFNKRKKDILNKYEQLEKISIQLQGSQIAKILDESKKVLAKDSFNLVVVGEFSRGKSTFINAILGGRILPSSTKPTTTVINKISYNDTPTYKLYFRGGEERVISRDEFNDIVAKRDPDMDDLEEVQAYNENIAYISTIAYADIQYPAALCQGNIEIIDTPGTNDLDQAREEITFKFIPESDVAILVLSANQILSQSEVVFLKERILSNDIQKIFFVINFKDRLASLEEEQKIMDYAYSHLKEIIDDPKIYMVSSKSALNYKRMQKGEMVKGKIPTTLEETGFSQLECEIGVYLMEERANLKLGKYIDRGIKLADELIENNIKLLLGVLGLKTQELTEKVNVLIPKIQEAKRIAREECSRLKSRLATIESDLIFQYRMELETICLSANHVVNRYVGDLEIEKILRAIEHEVAPLQVQLHEKMSNFKQTYIDRELERTLNNLKKVCDEISLQAHNELMVISNQDVEQLRDVKVNENINGEINLFENLVVGGAIFAMFSMPFVMIPTAIFGGKHFTNFFANRRRENFLTEVKLQVDRRYGEIIPEQIELFREAYYKNVESLINQLESEINNKITIFEEQLKSLLANKEKVEKDEKTEYEHLDTLRVQLEQIKMELRGV